VRRPGLPLAQGAGDIPKVVEREQVLELADISRA
jgi:hypothetical protein